MSKYMYEHTKMPPYLPMLLFSTLNGASFFTLNGAVSA